MNLEQEMCMSQLSFQITEPSALNVIVESLKPVRESTGSQCKCRSSAVVDLVGNEEF